jgi:hypothetical protein
MDFRIIYRASLLLLRNPIIGPQYLHCDLQPAVIIVGNPNSLRSHQLFCVILELQGALVDGCIPAESYGFPVTDLNRMGLYTAAKLLLTS